MIALRSTTTALAAAALAAAALAGCGEKRETGTGTTSRTTTVTSVPADTSLDVTETEFEIEPASPEIAKAGVVAFEIENTGKVDHALEIETPDGEIDTDSIPPGETATLKADLEPGTYKWYCPLADHEQRGMTGEVTVAGGGGSKTTPEDSGGGGSSGPGY